MSATLWLICVLSSGIYFLSIKTLYIVIVVGIATCLSISTFAYVTIYGLVRCHQLQIQVQQQAVEGLNTENNLNLMLSKKSAVNTFVFYICMILCYCAFFISTLVFVLFDKYSIVVWALTNTLVYLNSSINPFLYCWRLSELRFAVVKAMRKMLCKQTEET